MSSGPAIEAPRLHEAHERGIIHCDLKPSNIMIDRRGEPIVMDFGLARAIDDDAESRLTRDGMIVGTSAYMAPEQLDGSQKLGPATDIYALGVVLYELLAGRRPFSGSVVGVIGQILHSEPPALESLRPGVSTALASICRQAMAKRPEERFASMREFAESLTAYLKGDVATAVSQVAAPSVAPRERAAVREPAPESQVRRQADWWEVTEEALPSAPLPVRSAPRNRKRKSGPPPAVWAAGGALVALILAAAIAVPLFRGDGTAAGDTANARGFETVRQRSPGNRQLRRQTTRRRRNLRQLSRGRLSQTRSNRSCVSQSFPSRCPLSRHLTPNSTKRTPIAMGWLDAGELALHIIHRADSNGDERVTKGELLAAEKRLGRARLFAPPTPEEQLRLPGGPGQRGPLPRPGSRARQGVPPQTPPQRPFPPRN